MRWCRHATLLTILCLGCGSKPASRADAGGRTPSPQATASQVGIQPQQGAAQPQKQIQAKATIIAAGPTFTETPKPPIPHEAVATIPGAQRILFAAASPTTEEIFVLAQMSNDSYGGAFFVVRLDGTASTTETGDAVMEGTNAEYSDMPVWSPDGKTAYFVFDSGSFSPTGNVTGHGLFAWEAGSGNVTQIVKGAIGGLAISPDGSLAAFWDYSAGNKLTVYNLKKKQPVRTWDGQTHTADDLVISDLAFTPDGESLLARLYVPKDDPTMRYEIASGRVSPFAKSVQAMATVNDSLYFLQFEPVPFTNPEHPHRLMKWTTADAQPMTVAEHFHYQSLSASPGEPWLVGGSNGGYADGVAIYDTRTGQIQTAGKSCSTAVVTASGRVLYVFGSELAADAAVCSGPPPARAASSSKSTTPERHYNKAVSQ